MVETDSIGAEPTITDRDPGDEDVERCAAKSWARLDGANSPFSLCEKPHDHEGSHKAQLAPGLFLHWPRFPLA